VFLRTLDFSPFNVGEERPKLVRLIKALQPGASNQAIAEAIGVNRSTVDRDAKGGANAPLMTGAVPDGPPVGGANAPHQAPKPDDAEAAVAKYPELAEAKSGNDSRETWPHPTRSHTS
jgi:hypothetical protein